MSERDEVLTEVKEIIMIYPEFKDRFVTAMNTFFEEMDTVDANSELTVEEKALKFQEIGEKHAMPVLELIPS